MPLVLKAEPRAAIELSAAEQRIYDAYRQAFAGIGNINDSKVLRAIEDAINANNPLGAVNAVAWGDFAASLQNTVDALNKEVSRRTAKTIAFSILYGSGITALSEQLECSYDEAMEVKRAYLNSAPGIRDVQNKIKASWDIADPIKTWGGRYYFKEDQKMITDKRTGEQRLADFGYKGLNYLIQSSSADITKQAIINYNEIKQDGRFLLSVHDQIDISGPLSEMKLLKEAMSDIKLDVKLLSDGSYGNNMTTPETYDD